MTQISWLAEIAWKGTAILAAAFAAAALLRRASAAARHFVWTAAFAALLLLPLFIGWAPKWSVTVPAVAPHSTEVAIRPTATQATVHVVTPAPVNRAPVSRSIPVWIWMWPLGAAVVAVRFALGAMHTRRIVRGGAPAAYAESTARELADALGIRRGVAVLESAAAPVPLACGLLRPKVVLPGGAAGWPPSRLATVLRHELAHIRRRDLAAQALGQVVCCLYWFHPLAWLAAGRLRHERERACDDTVLAAGIPPHDYASDLVDLARGMAERRRFWADAPAMAEASDLEARIRALFDPSQNRRPLRRTLGVTIGAAAMVLLLPLASFTTHAQAARGVLVGVVADPSGARVPNSRVIATNQDTGNQEQTRADAVGEYRFNAISAGQYLVQILSPGFKALKLNATVNAGQVTRLDGNLEVGEVAEAVTVNGQKPPTVIPNAAGARQRIKIGGNVQTVQLLQQPKAEYPAELQQAGVQGTVVLQGIISKDGDVVSTKVLSTDVDPRLVQLALNAFKQYRYRPARLNGEPIEVMTTISIDFRLN
jgi:TonB family protein